MVMVPGSPSHLRPRKPPNLATIRVASRSEGGVSGGDSLWTTAWRTFHSSLVRTASRGRLGVSRPSFVSSWIRKATTMSMAWQFLMLSASSSCRSSTRQRVEDFVKDVDSPAQRVPAHPLAGVREIGYRHRCQYHPIDRLLDRFGEPDFSRVDRKDLHRSEVRLALGRAKPDPSKPDLKRRVSSGTTSLPGDVDFQCSAELSGSPESLSHKYSYLTRLACIARAAWAASIRITLEDLAVSDSTCPSIRALNVSSGTGALHRCGRSSSGGYWRSTVAASPQSSSREGQGPQGGPTGSSPWARSSTRERDRPMEHADRSSSSFGRRPPIHRRLTKRRLGTGSTGGRDRGEVLAWRGFDRVPAGPGQVPAEWLTGRPIALPQRPRRACAGGKPGLVR